MEYQEKAARLNNNKLPNIGADSGSDPSVKERLVRKGKGAGSRLIKQTCPS